MPNSEEVKKSCYKIFLKLLEMPIEEFKQRVQEHESGEFAEIIYYSCRTLHEENGYLWNDIERYRKKIMELKNATENN